MNVRYRYMYEILLVFNMRELLMCIHSVRLVELESEIVD